MGMILAALPGSPIWRLILNDVGPYLPHLALSRLGRYVGRAPDFDDLGAVHDYVREVYAPFGPLSEDMWWRLARHSARQDTDGRWRLSYDPQIGDAFRKIPQFFHFRLWKYWDAIECPVLVIRGEHADFLRRATAEEMTERGPRATLREVSGVGHTPMLMSPEEIGLIEAWLE